MCFLEYSWENESISLSSNVPSQTAIFKKKKEEKESSWPIPVLVNMIKVNVVKKDVTQHRTQLSNFESSYSLSNTVLQCIKFQNSTAHKIPQDSSGMSQVNFGTEHRFSWYIVGSKRSEATWKGKWSQMSGPHSRHPCMSCRKPQSKKRKKKNPETTKKQNNETTNFPFTEAMKLNGICSIVLTLSCNNIPKNTAVLRK